MVPGPDARRSDHARKEWAGECSSQSSVRQRSDSKTVTTNHSTQNDEQVVNERTERGKQKEPMRQQHGRNNATDVEENLRRQQNPGQADAQVDLVGRESFHEPAHELWREDLRGDRAYD